MKLRFIGSVFVGSLVCLGMACAQSTVPASADPSPVFPDVPPNHWAFAAVQKLAAAGIIEGRPALPNQPSPARVAETPPQTTVAVKQTPGQNAETDFRRAALNFARALRADKRMQGAHLGFVGYPPYSMIVTGTVRNALQRKLAVQMIKKYLGSSIPIGTLQIASPHASTDGTSSNTASSATRRYESRFHR